jgi:hypothetical protein
MEAQLQLGHPSHRRLATLLMLVSIRHLLPSPLTDRELFPVMMDRLLTLEK